MSFMTIEALLEFLIIFLGAKTVLGGLAIKPLPRVTWLKLAIGAVKGLAFLNQLDRQIISRVFKISN